MTTGNEILLNAGMTQQQILAGRMRNVAERMQRDVELAALLVSEGAKVWQELYPATPPDKLAAWASLTLQASSAQLESKKQTAVPAYPEPYDVLIPNQQALVDSLPAGGKRRREQKTLDNMREEAAAMADGQ
jgi:hypothetical protein